MNQQQKALAAVMVIGLIAFAMTRSSSNDPQPEASPSAVASAEPTPEPTPVPVGPRPNEVLIAKRTLRPAEVSIVSTNDVDLRVMPDEDYIPEGAIKTYDEISNKILISPVYEGEVFVGSRFIDEKKVLEQRLKSYVPKNHRAISLQVDAVSGATGFISQGDIVDVVALYQAAGKTFARIILQNVTVMAKGGEYRPRRAKEPQARIAGGDEATQFTLLVDPRMAVRLAHLVDRRGVNQFRLLLKNPDDRELVHTRGVLLSEIITGVPRPPLDEDVEAGEGVEILRGPAIDRELGPEESLGEGDEGFTEGEFGAEELLDEGDGSATTVNPQELGR